ncbi:MAG: hypothetical protein KAS64_03555 [Spirochaetes bacterium]|nr:hypothetical protein [Spirochaetota bacterium]
MGLSILSGFKSMIKKISCLMIVLMMLQLNINAQDTLNKKKEFTIKKKYVKSINKDQDQENLRKKLLEKRILKYISLKRKDPFIAGLLSWSMWGLGHIYSKDYTKGSFLVFLDLIYKGLIVGYMVKINNKYTSQNDGDSSISWGELSSGDKGLAIGLLVVYIGVSFFSALDASTTAKEYNRKNNIDKYLQIGISNSDGYPSVQVGWKIQF